MSHGEASSWGKDNASDFKTKMGINLFFVYCIIYSGFVAINTVKPKLMEANIIFGLNLACIYGFGLIILAIIMGLIYNSVCTKAEDRMNTIVEGEQK